jgi:hypothetical protein
VPPVRHRTSDQCADDDQFDGPKCRSLSRWSWVRRFQWRQWCQRWWRVYPLLPSHVGDYGGGVTAAPFTLMMQSSDIHHS